MKQSSSTPPEHLLDKAGAAQILQPHIDNIQACLDAGIKQLEALKKCAPEFCLGLTPRGKSCIVYEGMLQEARKRFDGVKGVRMSEKYGTIVVYLQEQLSFRFKKMDSKGRTSNIRTKRQDRITGQMTLFDMPDPALVTHVTAGYQLDNLGQNAVKQAIICSWGKEKLWEIDVTPNAAPIFTAFPVAPQRAATKTKVKGKPELQPKEKDVSENS